MSAGVDAIGSLISRAWIAGSGRIRWVAAGSGHQDRGECARGDSPNAKRYVRERRSQPTDRRESTLSGTARAFGVGDSTLRAWLEPIRRGASLDPLSAVEVISMVAGRLPPSSAHPTRPKVLVSPSLISNRLSRTPPRGHVVCPTISTERHISGYRKASSGKAHSARQLDSSGTDGRMSSGFVVLSEQG